MKPGPRRRLGLLADRIYDVGPISFSWATWMCGDWTLGITVRRGIAGERTVLRLNLGSEALCFSFKGRKAQP
jgi:hypothetical protein